MDESSLVDFQGTWEPEGIEGGARDLSCEQFRRSRVANRGPDRLNPPRPRGSTNSIRDQYSLSQPSLFRNQFSSNFTGRAKIKTPAGGPSLCGPDGNLVISLGQSHGSYLSQGSFTPSPRFSRTREFFA